MTGAERREIAGEWRRAGDDALAAASELLSGGRYRGSVRRSYYAAYAFLAELLVMQPSVMFRGHREGPEHEPLAGLVGDHLAGVLPRSALQRTRVTVRVLYALRVHLTADYPQRLLAVATLTDGRRIAYLTGEDAITPDPAAITGLGCEALEDIDLTTHAYDSAEDLEDAVGRAREEFPGADFSRAESPADKS